MHSQILPRPASATRIDCTNEVDSFNEVDVHRQIDSTPSHRKVLHVINGEHYSGAERVQDLLAGRLPEFGYDLSFACVKPGLFEERRNFRGSKIYSTAMRNRFDFGAAKRIARLVDDQQFELIHAHTPRSAVVAAMAASRTNTPFVYHVHSPTSRDSTRWWINWLNQRVENWALKKATHIVTVSKSLASHMQRLGFEQNRVTTIPNGVPIQKDCSGRSSDKPGEKLVLGTVALFRPRKGTEVLIDAVARLKKMNLPVELLAVGPFESSEYENQLKTQAKRLGVDTQIRWTGFSSDVAKLFPKMDLFVLPSLFGEGLPMVLLEAMSQAIPVIASEVEGVPEAIRRDVDGLIVPPRDAQVLADKIRVFWEHPELRSRLSKSALNRQRDHFSDLSMARQLASLYDRLLASDG